MHADSEETIRAINLFDSRITDLTVGDVGILAHGFEEKANWGSHWGS